MYFCSKQTQLIIIYKIAIQLASLILPIIGLFNKKVKKGVTGRKKTLPYLKNNLNQNKHVFWFHCASLGEYEQGLPLFKSLKEAYPYAEIVLSFLSPSGYEIRKENPITTHVVYLPLDNLKNVRNFLKILSPKLVVFVKYDLWPNYLISLSKCNAKVYLISALFRPNQIYFSFIFRSFSRTLFSFDHIFTQNKSSKNLLNSIGYMSATVSNDTRFDRVSSQLKQNNTISFVDKFKGNDICLVAGSTWPEDIDIMLPFLKKIQNEIKFIIAPHIIEKQEIIKLKNKLGEKAELYSNINSKSIEKKRILIIDSIGVLTKLYSYADIAYVGGGMGVNGLHNTLEAAVFSIPIIIGRNYEKFPEAKEMIKLGGTTSVSSVKSFQKVLNLLLNDENLRVERGNINKRYIDSNEGATKLILEKINSSINL
ncbi:MAG: 3-deoxy-D-manno-octulosonic acid transferase [Flavobacteriaceae bacterium]|nr:3-deoxy-D-manno-octulosonic acid transferase [Flavobacteriaceae bacterium]|tara:strand:- start:2960 stop:4231 length:1272 start_codon:yes stop_codon:yes gene_type:complete